MHEMLLKIAAWLGQKLLAAALIVALALAAYGAWLFLQDEVGGEQQRVEKMQRALVERERLLALQADIERRIAATRAEVAKQRERAKQAEKVIATLRELESWWERWFGNPKQQTANTEQLQRMEALKSDATGKVAELQRTITQIVWEKDGAETALRRLNFEIATLETSESTARRYARRAWESTKWLILVALAGYFFGPTLWKLTTYYGIAPFMSRGRPIRLGAEPAALPAVGESGVSLDATLRAGDVMRIKEKFLQASDESVRKKTRFVFDWRIPFTSVAAGLIELVELRHTGDGESRVTLSNSDDPHLELAMIEVPAGGSLILRPSFLAGAIQREDERLEIRRHWRFRHWQAWVSGQFRFFEFVGPCRLCVSGSRGIRAERLAERAGQTPPARRTNQDATIGFTPNLDYLPVRAETFWSYYRGMNPLFDDLFAGQGLFVLQETAAEGPGAKAGKFWSGIWNAVLKVFGL